MEKVRRQRRIEPSSTGKSERVKSIITETGIETATEIETKTGENAAIATRRRVQKWIRKSALSAVATWERLWSAESWIPENAKKKI